MNQVLRLLICALAALAAGAAPAQDWRIDASEQLDQCLSEAPDRGAEAACMYIVNDACIAATRDETTIGMAECLTEETNVWDMRLNAIWPDIVAAAQAQDARDAGADGGYETTLRAAQRAWIAYRDAECAWAYQRWSAGTVRVLFGAGCQLEMTANRVLDFREWQRDH